MSAPLSSGELHRQLKTEYPDFDFSPVSMQGWERLDRLADASSLYRRLIFKRPDYCLWLEDETTLTREFRFRALADEWIRFESGSPDGLRDSDRLARLRRFRRRISLRIAYREINRLCDGATTTRELTRLAEFCVRECLALSLRQWESRYGHPWDEELDKPARFCVLGLGKMGGEELNFSSDIDLIYLYEGEGHCRRDGRAGTNSNAEYFTKVAESLTGMLQDQTEDGFLFRTDLRLRPEGTYGPLVRSLPSLEHYYAAAGQSWERLALIKARPVAGDLALGAELLEILHAFRYPRHPPPSLIHEIAALKVRTEREVVGHNALARNVKSGYGGIREVEFVVQTFQLLHAGRYPFLQTGSTMEALEQLARYQLFPAEEAAFLGEAYWFLRAVEHRVQIREEQRTHELPEAPDELAAVSRSLGFSSLEAFNQKLEATRSRVRTIYQGLFGTSQPTGDFADWWLFFTEGKAPDSVAEKVRFWFRGESGSLERLRLFGRGDSSHQINREQITRFLDLARSFDEVLPRLARPLPTLLRIERFAERYGTRAQFFQACAINPQLFQAVALLFDRSRSIHEVLCRHPEILEEVLRPEILRKKKTPAVVRRELAAGRNAPDPAAWLWLYVRAEQIRFALGELLEFTALDEVEANLSVLADAVVRELLAAVDPENQLLVVALGKFGAGELSFGSDLDLLFLSSGNDTHALEPKVRDLIRRLAPDTVVGHTYEIDLRLRPHGQAGPMLVTLEGLGAYHRNSAQAWEKLALTQSRVVAGPPDLAASFSELVDQLLYSGPLPPTQEGLLWEMRWRIERERDAVSPPERAFKTGPGGRIDFEFAAQIAQLRHGHDQPGLRRGGTREVLSELGALGRVPLPVIEQLLENHAFLKRLEFQLRRNTYKGESVIDSAPEAIDRLAFWLGFGDTESFWTEHGARMRNTRRLLIEHLGMPNTPSIS